jgi:hypothetical protein
MASAGHSSELQSVVALVKTLTNAQLKDILRSEGLAVSGVKASLQLRIIDCSFSLYLISPFHFNRFSRALRLGRTMVDSII